MTVTESGLFATSVQCGGKGWWPGAEHGAARDGTVDAALQLLEKDGAADVALELLEKAAALKRVASDAILSFFFLMQRTCF